MNIFHYVDIPQLDQLQNQLLEWLTEQSLLTRVISWQTVSIDQLLSDVPRLGAAVKSLGTPVMAAVIQRAAGFSGGVHIDSGLRPRLLIPVARCQGSETRFFAQLGQGQYSQGLQGDRYRLIAADQWGQELARADLARPIVFDPQIAHGIWTNPQWTLPRITLTVGFQELLVIKDQPDI